MFQNTGEFTSMDTRIACCIGIEFKSKTMCSNVLFSTFGYSNFLVKQAERARTHTHHCIFKLRNVGKK
jgi:hypothetical protein